MVRMTTSTLLWSRFAQVDTLRESEAKEITRREEAEEAGKEDRRRRQEVEGRVQEMDTAVEIMKRAVEEVRTPGNLFSLSLSLSLWGEGVELGS